MKLNRSRLQQAGGYTLTELLVSAGISCILLAAAVTASISLQKSFNAIDNFFSSEMQQIRLVDYMTRDVKRGFSVVTSTDLHTVTITVPKYIIEAGDAEAIANPALIGTPRAPSISRGINGMQVNYGTGTSTIAYSINGTTVARTQDGGVTNVSTSASQLLPTTTDVQLANTEFSKTVVTFLPTFSSSNAAVLRASTATHSTAYLRNKRRGG